MKLIVYAMVQMLIRLAPREVQVVLLYSAASLLAFFMVRGLLRIAESLHSKARAYLELRRARRQLMALDLRRAQDAKRPTPLDPYRHAKTFMYSKELDQILAPLSDEQRGALLIDKQLSAEIKEAMQRYKPDQAA